MPNLFQPLESRGWNLPTNMFHVPKENLQSNSFFFIFLFSFLISHYIKILSKKEGTSCHQEKIAEMKDLMMRGYRRKLSAQYKISRTSNKCG